MHPSSYLGQLRVLFLDIPEVRLFIEIVGIRWLVGQAYNDAFLF